MRIGVENLARTAGYPDPLRFTWAMEAAEAGDLADGPVVVSKGDVELTLSVDPEGVADLAVRRGSRALKSVPAALREDPDVAGVQERKKSLVQQATRVRLSLEAAMTAQDISRRTTSLSYGSIPSSRRCWRSSCGSRRTG